MTARHQAIRAWLTDHEQEEIAFLASLVNQDSGTFDRLEVNKVGDRLERSFADLGFRASRLPGGKYGDHVLATRGEQGPGLLCLGHMDTVFPAGTAAARPFAVAGSRVTGPGVLDMKGGLAALVFALRGLEAAASPALGRMRCTILVNTEEEIGSPTSREAIVAEARRHDAAVVLEPARPNGECVIGRKGVGHFRVEAFGRQAHAGSQPELGINAISELARKIPALEALADATLGTTVNVGVVRGGERSNVVPDYAYADLDLRIWSDAEGERVKRGIAEIASCCTIPGATGTWGGEIGFPAWGTNEGTRRMLQILQAAAAPLGLRFAGTTSGGGSDGNRTASIIPTLDGLGPVGSKLHSPEEYLELPSLVERTTLLACFIERWVNDFKG
jgi:glutamate carboxypeptidase